MSNPLISILMTVYNREKYLSDAIKSIMTSSHQNWELIIVDDQSKDKSVEIAKQYECKDSRIKVYLNEENLGDYPNRNKAASYAKGKYIKYLDADDLIYPETIAKMVNTMEEYPEAGYGLLSTQQDISRPFPFLLSPELTYREYYFNSKDYFNRAPLSAIIKKEVFDSVGGFSGLQHLGDFELWHKLSLNNPVVIISHSHGFVWYRTHEDQQINDNRTNPFVPFKYLIYGFNFFKSESNIPLSALDKSIIIKRYKKQIARSIIKSSVHSLAKMMELKKYSKFTWYKILTYSIS